MHFSRQSAKKGENKTENQRKQKQKVDETITTLEWHTAPLGEPQTINSISARWRLQSHKCVCVIVWLWCWCWWWWWHFLFMVSSEKEISPLAPPSLFFSKSKLVIESYRIHNTTNTSIEYPSLILYHLFHLLSPFSSISFLNLPLLRSCRPL